MAATWTRALLLRPVASWPEHARPPRETTISDTLKHDALARRVRASRRAERRDISVVWWLSGCLKQWQGGAVQHRRSLQRRKQRFSVGSSGRRGRPRCVHQGHSWRRLERVARRGLQRRAGSLVAGRKKLRAARYAAQARVLPSPSLTRSAHCRPPGPVSSYGVHFLLPGPGVLPLTPAYLER